jgi:hypoxanthine-DNA glycosylase
LCQEAIARTMPFAKEDKQGPQHRRGLPPVVGPRPRVLILGTIPSVLSDRLGQYYGNPQNHFWRLMGEALGVPPSPVYEERTALFKERGIALWDVLAECHVRGSKDHSIVDPVPNDLASLLTDHPTIGHLFLNGKKAMSLYAELIECTLRSPPPPLTVLPSSSPANAMRWQEKARAWMAIQAALHR